MRTSIRWRLAGAFALVALVAVGALGGLALGLVSSLAEHRELADLRTNAETVAAQALPVMAAGSMPEDLAILAHTSAFLGDRRVRIFGPDQVLLVDTGNSEAADQVVWLAETDPSAAGMHQFTMRLAGPPPLFAGMHPELIPQPGDAGQVLSSVDAALAAEGEEAPDESRALRVHRLLGPGGPTLRLAWTEAMAAAPLHGPGAFPFQASDRAVRVAVGDPDRPAGFVELSGGPDVSGQVVATARRAITLAAGAATLLAGALGLVFSRSLTAPLAGLALAARRMESGDLSARVESGGPEEIDSLARAFNGMADSLQSTVSDLAADRDALSRFVADASHQLRTPITALATYLQLVADRVDDDETGKELIREGQSQVARLEWVTSNLLDLSRMDAGVTQLLIEPVDADDLLAASAGPFRETARAQGTELEVVGSGGLVIHCDRAHLEMAIGNLLDNALKNTGEGDRVTLSAASDPDGVLIRTRDTGPGFVGVDAERVFDRFYRGGAAGAGLGLAVVAGVAVAHGGSAMAHSVPGGGAEVVIVLPAARQRPQ